MLHIAHSSSCGLSQPTVMSSIGRWAGISGHSHQVNSRVESRKWFGQKQSNVLG